MLRYRFALGSGLLAWALAAFLVSGLTASVASAFPEGVTRGGTTCGNCHGSTVTSSLTISLSGPTLLAPGDTGTYTASIAELNDGAGFNFALTGDAALAMITAEANTQLDGDELTHVDGRANAPAGNLGDWSYDFEVVVDSLATVGSTIELFLAMMAIEFDGSADEMDIWNTATSSITVTPEPATAVLLAGGLVGMAFAGRRRR